MDSAYMYHSSHYDAGVTRRIFGDVSLNCDDDIYSCSRRLRPASYSLGKPGVTPGHPRSLRVRRVRARREPDASPARDERERDVRRGPAGPTRDRLPGDGHPAQRRGDGRRSGTGIGRPGDGPADH